MGTDKSAGNQLTAGLVIGGGTGPEIATVFRRALERLSRIHQVTADTIECPHSFGTYFGSLESGSAPQIQRQRERESSLYQEFVADLARSGVPCLFRTAMDAQTLYMARERLGAVKVETIDTPTARILLVRDCGQGFYGGNNDTDSGDVIRRTCEFRRDWTQRLIDHALEIGASHFGGIERIDHVVAAYKFHLLDCRFAQWVSDHARRRDVTIGLFQPDTMNRNLLRGAYKGNVVLIGANEWVDIVHVEMMNRYGTGTHETRAAHSTYLADGVAGMVEYQTVHGSADDIAGKGVVNPLATLRAAASILERHAGCAGAVERMEHAIARGHGRGFGTPDQGGEDTTDAVAEAVLDACAEQKVRRAEPRHARDDTHALLVVDMQNDMCAPGGCFDRLGLIDTSRMAELGRRLQALLEQARLAGAYVLHSRTHADIETLPANMARRIQRFGRDGYLRAGSWGAAHYGPAAAAHEQVVIKRGYDPFLQTDLRERLRPAEVHRLVLVGVFADICIDAAARSAYQLGITPVVLGDMTLALERELDQSLSFMERYYGARIMSSADWLAEIRGAATDVAAGA